MIKGKTISLVLVAFFTASCSYKQAPQDEEKVPPIQQSIRIKGNKITNGNFTGDVWLQMAVEADAMYTTSVGTVTFAPGARTNWHLHPGGQILLITNGQGLYREKGKPIQVIKEGDVVKCPPNVVHWHGATANDTMVHIAIGPNTDKGSVIWMEKVSDEDYAGRH